MGSRILLSLRTRVPILELVPRIVYRVRVRARLPSVSNSRVFPWVLVIGFYEIQRSKFARFLSAVYES